MTNSFTINHFSLKI